MAFHVLSYATGTMRMANTPAVMGDADFNGVVDRPLQDLLDFVHVLGFTSIVTTGGYSSNQRREQLRIEANQNLQLHTNVDIRAWEVMHKQSMPSDGGWVTLASGWMAHPRDVRDQSGRLVYHDTGVMGDPERYVVCVAMICDAFFDVAGDGSNIKFFKP